MNTGTSEPAPEVMLSSASHGARESAPLSYELASSVAGRYRLPAGAPKYRFEAQAVLERYFTTDTSM
jgi:hypothetical protein